MVIKGNLIQEKSFAFAIRIVNLYKFLTKEKHEFVLSKQLLRSGTSIGANVEEGIGTLSEADFQSKLNISYKEARETIYWIKLLHATDLQSKEQSENLLNDADEICRILARILITIKSVNNVKTSISNS